MKANKLASESDITKIYGNAHVGGQVGMWDKTELFQGEKFGMKFEHLEIEEFLNESGLNETDVEFLQKLEQDSAGLVTAITQQQTSNNSGQQNFNINLNSNNNLQQQQQQSFQANQIKQPTQTFQLMPVAESNGSPKHYSSTHSSASSSSSDISQSGFDYSMDNDLSIDSMDFEGFNPKTRKFNEDELKPQPILKKSKKVNSLSLFAKQKINLNN